MALNRDTITAAIIWILAIVVGEILLFSWDIFPVAASREAIIVDDAFLLLSALAIPVMALVVTVIGYSVVKFRRAPDDLTDGPPVRTHTRWVSSWLVWTSALCVAVIIYPGYTGLLDLRETNDHEADVTVDVVGHYWWTWSYAYPNHGVANVSDELVLPRDSLIRFNVTSGDLPEEGAKFEDFNKDPYAPKEVLHSFWIPAFRIKIDAVPGLLTHVDTTTKEPGEYNADINFRVQCAELCGIGHTDMSTPVRVVEQAEFDAWIAGRVQ